jgi:glucose-6-phosphate 1-dehydrogenase
VTPPSGEAPGRSKATASGRPQVLILDGGFGGIGAARKLRQADVDVTLVDRHDHHTFQPLVHQVATDLLKTTACGHPLRDLFHEQPIPPFLFGTVVEGLHEAGHAGTARVVVEKPFGHHQASARALAAEVHQYIERET